MTTFECLTYAQERLALAKAFCDHAEVEKWQERVTYWRDKLEAEEKERGLTPRVPDAGDSASFLELFYPIFNLLNKASRTPPQRR
jgi:hypothetical protein